MKKLYKLFMITTALVISANAAKSEGTAQTKSTYTKSKTEKGVKVVDYKVVSGDTLYIVAKKHHTTVKEVLDANNMSISDTIHIGQMLKVPVDTYMPKLSGKISKSKEVSSKKTAKTKTKTASKSVKKVAKEDKVAKTKGQKSTHKKTKTASKTSKPKTVDYKVVSGDTLYIVAKKHHTTVKEVLDANNMSISDTIHIGQMLKVPVDTYMPNKTASKEQKSKSVQKTASKKTDKTKTKTASKSVKKVAKGDKIAKTKEQKSTQKETTPRVHIVDVGETLFGIALKYHTTLKALMKLNNIGTTYMIKAGDKLILPTTTYRKKETTKVAKKEEKREKEKKITKTKVAKNSKTQKELNTKKSTSKSKKYKIVKETVTKTKTHTVKHGDTLWQIAKNNKISLKELRKLNGMSKKDVIHTGMVLKVGVEKIVITKKIPVKTKVAVAKKKVYKSKTYKVKKGDTLWKIAKRNKLSLSEIRKLNGMSKKDVIHTGMILKVSKPIEVKEKVRVASKKSKKSIAKNTKKDKKTKVAKKTKTKKVKVASKSKKRRNSKRKNDKRIQKAIAMLSGRNSSYKGSRSVIREAKKYLGKRYVWGAEGPNKFDCSGFTQYVMRKSKGVKIPRVSRKQAYYGKYVSRKNLKPGDLIFFDTSRRRRGYVNHVGIYIGNNKFIHASSARHRVVITSLNRPFYRSRFKWGRRIN